jgi:hypothetical protein
VFSKRSETQMLLPVHSAAPSRHNAFRSGFNAVQAGHNTSSKRVALNVYQFNQNSAQGIQDSK